MKIFVTSLWISLVTLFGNNLYAQTLKGNEQLLRFSETKHSEFLLKKEKAIDFAKLNHLPLTINTDFGFLELMLIDELGMPEYYLTSNANSARTISTNKLFTGAGFGFNLSGAGMTLHEWDAGAVLGSHQEFGNRVIQADEPASVKKHSTHVAGTMIASGVKYYSKGMAPSARIRAFDWNNDAAEMAAEAASGALVSNHSYGIAGGWVGGVWYGNPSISTQEDYKFGFYGSYAHDWDLIAYNAPYYLIVKSAGNERNSCGDNSYPCNGPYDCISGSGLAKNVLTVGAVEDIVEGYSEPSDVVMSDFSSWGPSDDGRIKPDLVANGTSVYSTYTSHNKAYEFMSGTSMAAAAVSGSMILLQELFQNLNGEGNFLKASTLKAIAIHTADEARNAPGPDYEFGWGLLNIYKAANLILSENQFDTIIEELTLNEGQKLTYSYTYSGDNPLQVTLVWTDPPGNPTSPSLDPEDKMLVNDLDLKVAGMDKVFYPWKMDRNNPAKAATNTSKNKVDNVEVVLINNPVKNATYTISIDHDGILTGGSQDFSIVISPVAKPEMPLLSEDIVWTKNFGGSTDDNAFDVVPSSNNGFFVTGGAFSSNIDVYNNHGDSDFWILKLDDNGDTLWTRALGGSETDEAFSILQTTDGGCVAVGSTFSGDFDVAENKGDSDIWIVKLDSTGQLVKTKTLGGVFYESANSIIQTADSGFIIVGCSTSKNGDIHGNNGHKDGWVVKLNNLGDTLWTQNYGGSYDDEIKSIVQTQDGGFIIAGSTNSNNGDVRGNHGGSDCWVVKIDSAGKINWSKAIGSSKGDEANAVCQSTDGGFLVAGYTHSSNVNIDFFIVKLSNSGNIIWTKTIGGSQTDIAKSIVQSNDGGYWVAGFSDSDDGNLPGNYGGRDGFLIKLTDNGSIIWSKNFGGSFHDELHSVKQLPDSSVIMVGFSNSFYGDIPKNNGHADYWMIKLKPNISGIPGFYLSSPQKLGTSGHTDVALGDMDNDGDLDAVVTKDGDGQPNSVWINDGYGNFSDSGLNFGNGISWGIALGDLDNDGDLDGFVANNGANKVYLNNGYNTSDNGQSLGIANSRDVALGDIDGDGDLDAVVANIASSEVNKIWLNNGSGYFTALDKGFGEDASYGIALGDLDMDGDLDGFVANIGVNKIYLNNGGNTADNGQLLGNSNSVGICLGDLDGDNDLDAVIANNGSSEPNKVWLNRGDGSFVNNGLNLGTSISMDVALGDIDGDGYLDGFVANDGPNKIYLNNGNTTTDNGQLLGNSKSYGIALGDLDGDGDIDAFVANYDSPCTIWLNQSPQQTNKQITGQNTTDGSLEQLGAIHPQSVNDIVFNNYPNPYSMTTTIRFRLHKTTRAVIRLSNLYGKFIKQLYDATAEAEQEYNIQFLPKDLPSGIYVMQLETENGLKVNSRMMLIK